jgi:hypothetical protein
MSYSHNGFESDAAFFDLVAQYEKNKQEQQQLREVALTYRSLAKTPMVVADRSEHWRKRAEKCRALADQFKTEICREELTRLAKTYDMLADATT